MPAVARSSVLFRPMIGGALFPANSDKNRHRGLPGAHCGRGMPNPDRSDWRDDNSRFACRYDRAARRTGRRRSGQTRTGRRRCTSPRGCQAGFPHGGHRSQRPDGQRGSLILPASSNKSRRNCLPDAQSGICIQNPERTDWRGDNIDHMCRYHHAARRTGRRRNIR